MFTYIINTFAASLIALGAYQGVQAFLNVTVTSEPLALVTAGCFILMITALGGLNDR